ncbi:hypothetical protein C1Y63_01170 [Corynebacterium sp. 13CS0277]|uniref:hypothetical protein n=1 Tax=Corynebacterium sp. 13CS0277 TaxID=2071994 RepID=UPI000D02E7BB|nr:hypothetical protein [Corynebacterium sp. 13CS0277]PRQ12431.1 hypothetical protein C1Y63_01170 [Corynebacterium sp. 13CS0277]
MLHRYTYPLSPQLRLVVTPNPDVPIVAQLHGLLYWEIAQVEVSFPEDSGMQDRQIPNAALLEMLNHPGQWSEFADTMAHEIQWAAQLHPEFPPPELIASPVFVESPRLVALGTVTATLEGAECSECGGPLVLVDRAMLEKYLASAQRMRFAAFEDVEMQRLEFFDEHTRPGMSDDKAAAVEREMLERFPVVAKTPRVKCLRCRKDGAQLLDRAADVVARGLAEWEEISEIPLGVRDESFTPSQIGTPGLPTMDPEVQVDAAARLAETFTPVAWESLWAAAPMRAIAAAHTMANDPAVVHVVDHAEQMAEDSLFATELPRFNYVGQHTPQDAAAAAGSADSTDSADSDPTGSGAAVDASDPEFAAAVASRFDELWDAMDDEDEDWDDEDFEDEDFDEEAFGEEALRGHGPDCTCGDMDDMSDAEVYALLDEALKPGGGSAMARAAAARGVDWQQHITPGGKAAAQAMPPRLPAFAPAFDEYVGPHTPRTVDVLKRAGLVRPTVPRVPWRLVWPAHDADPIVPRGFEMMITGPVAMDDYNLLYGRLLAGQQLRDLTGGRVATITVGDARLCNQEDLPSREAVRRLARAQQQAAHHTPGTQPSSPQAPAQPTPSRATAAAADAARTVPVGWARREYNTSIPLSVEEFLSYCEEVFLDFGVATAVEMTRMFGLPALTADEVARVRAALKNTLPIVTPAQMCDVVGYALAGMRPTAAEYDSFTDPLSAAGRYIPQIVGAPTVEQFLHNLDALCTRREEGMLFSQFPEQMEAIRVAFPHPQVDMPVAFQWALHTIGVLTAPYPDHVQHLYFATIMQAVGVQSWNGLMLIPGPGRERSTTDGDKAAPGASLPQDTSPDVDSSPTGGGSGPEGSGTDSSTPGADSAASDTPASGEPSAGAGDIIDFRRRTTPQDGAPDSPEQ